MAPPPPTPPPQRLPHLFVAKKSKILAALATPAEEYSDKSPKGTVDAPIVGLIGEVNAVEGLVTTSSCSGRVSVFVEGPRGGSGDEDEDGIGNGDGDGEEGDKLEGRKRVKGGPGGKGGGRWLFVSHERVEMGSRCLSSLGNDADSAVGSPARTTTATTTTTTTTSPRALSSTDSATTDSSAPTPEASQSYFLNLCGLQLKPPPGSSSLNSNKPTSSTASQSNKTPSPPPRLIHLSFSPLILHILTATLAHHARPLLSAAINAGFRESGVQSLAAIADSPPTTTVGTMVAIRTAGLAFDTVIGRVRVESDDEGNETEVMEAVVDEEYLEMCFRVVNERFGWNEGRRERLREEIARRFGLGSGEGMEKEGRRWEGKEERRRRMRAEGLKRREDLKTKDDDDIRDRVEEEKTSDEESGIAGLEGGYE